MTCGAMVSVERTELQVRVILVDKDQEIIFTPEEWFHLKGCMQDLEADPKLERVGRCFAPTGDFVAGQGT